MTIDLSANNPRIVYTVGGTPQTVFTVPFDFFASSDVNVYVDGVLKTSGTDYNLASDSSGPVTFVSGVSNCEVAITRDVPLERTTDFTQGAAVNGLALNDQLDRITTQIADIDDKASRALQLDDFEVAGDMTIPAKASRKGYTLAFNDTTGEPEVGPLVTDVAAANTHATNAAASAAAAAADAAAALASESAAGSSASSASTSATNAAASESAAATSATAASASETAAATSETNAAASETAAALSATNASTSETNAATSASNAATSETNAASAQVAAETARDQTLSAYDNFDDRYLGTKASDPTLDNDGNPLVGGALYYNTTDEVMKVYTGTVWVAAYASLSGALLVANNLSDLANTASARTNLGLATTDSPSFVAALLGDGSAATPSITNTGDTDTGLFFPAADTVGVSTAGSEAMRIDSSGNVGIGTTLAVTNSALSVNGGVNSETGIFGQNTGDTFTLNGKTQPHYGFNFDNAASALAGVSGYYGLAFATNGVERMRIDRANGRVGIGTTSPSAKLDVASVSGWTPIVTRSSTLFAGISSDSAAGGNDVIFSTGAPLRFSTMSNSSGTGYTERMRIDSGGKVGIGTTSPDANLVVSSAGDTIIKVAPSSAGTARLNLAGTGGGAGAITSIENGLFLTTNDTGPVVVSTNGSEAMRIDSSGNVLAGKTSDTTSTAGTALRSSGAATFTTTNSTTIFVNRQSTDGQLMEFRQGNVAEGSISVSGTTVSYNGGHLSRWSRLPDGTDDSNILKGTVMTNLDQMIEWTDEDGNPEDNEQLNFTNTSSVEGDPNVAGVFVAWDDSDEWGDYYLAMTGDMVIRIAQGVTVQQGDLLMSAGDGTAKPQEDDLVRSKTIAKVISTHKSHEYADGSYCVPCVLMAC